MIYFLLYLFLETIVSVNIASAIGGLATFFEIVFSALIGVAILVNFHSTMFENLRAVSFGQIDLEEFERLNLFTIIGAILLIIPGFLTDIIGILLQLSTFTSMLINRYGVQSKKENNTFYTDQIYKESQDDVIDVEIIEKNTTCK